MAVSVVGMHRSGTSMVTKFLHDCGLYLGPDDDLMPAAAENPEGFWENLNFLDVNEEVLNLLGGGWDCPPPEPDDWTGGRLASEARRAETILAHFVGREPWGWKDPRTSLTLPFWKTLLPDLRVVLVVRNPLEVALSLRQRNGFSYALGLTLWRITNQRILAATTPANRVVTHYDACFADPATEVRRLLTGLDLPVPEDRLPALAAGGGLRHHRQTMQDLFDADVSTEVLDLYAFLCAEAGWSDTYGERPTRSPRPSATVTPPGLAEPLPLEAGVGRVARSAMDVRVLQRELDEHRGSLRGREERVAELEQALLVQQAAREERDERIERLERRADELEHERRIVENERDAVMVEATMLQRTAADQGDHLAALGGQLQGLIDHEAELRTLLGSAHQQLLYRDAEIIGNLGASLHPHAPGAPSAIYYRQLLDKVRALVETALPPAVPALVVSGGDDAMLRLDGRPAWHFPEPKTPVADGSAPDGGAAIAQLETLRERGAGFLVVPAPGRAWLARYPDLEHHLSHRFTRVMRDAAVGDVYALTEPNGGAP